MINIRAAYAGKTSLVTGHTGFKGAWLSTWLEQLGAKVMGYSLDPPTSPSLFKLAGLDRFLTDIRGDVADLERLSSVIRDVRPDFVFHLAALPLVRSSYEQPVETFATNVMGLVHVLEALRNAESSASVVVVTSDKCYLDRAWHYSYREDDSLGGADPYSASKAAQEIITGCYRASFSHDGSGMRLASARAGNVLGGGDWAKDRVVPDTVRALISGTPVELRNPQATRPWQHVLQPLSGYLLLGAHLATDNGADFAGAWNFGPESGTHEVSAVVDMVLEAWGHGEWRPAPGPLAHSETGTLALSVQRAQSLLGWRPVWGLGMTIERTVGWYQNYYRSTADSAFVRQLCLDDIEEFEQSSAALGLNWFRGN